MPVVHPQRPQEQEQMMAPPTIVNLDFIRTGAQFGAAGGAQAQPASSPPSSSSPLHEVEPRPRASSARRLEAFYQATQQAVEKAVEVGARPTRSLPISIPNNKLGGHHSRQQQQRQESEQQEQQDHDQENRGDDAQPITIVNLDFLRTGSQFGSPELHSEPELTGRPRSSSQKLEEFYRKTQEALERATADGKAPKKMLAPSSPDVLRRRDDQQQQQQQESKSLPSDLVLNVSFLKSGSQFKGKPEEPEIHIDKHLTSAQRLESFHLKMQKAVEEAARKGFSPKTQQRTVR